MSKQPLREEDVAAAFRGMAEEHAAEREPYDRERTWRSIQYQLQHDELQLSELHEAAPRREPLAFPWRRSLGRLALPALAAAAIAVLAVGAGTLLGTPLLGTPQPTASAAPQPSGAIRTETASKSVDFGDGSRVVLAPHTALSIEVLGAQASRTQLEHGRIEVSVRPRAGGADYRFAAGPYEVQGADTRFEISWDPAQQAFKLGAQTGSVRVLGPAGLDRVVSGGQTLELGPPQSAVAASSIELRAPIVSVDRTLRKPSDAPSSEAPDFAALVASGRFAEVVSTAESLGLEQVLREKSASELNALAHAANYTGRWPLAVQTWTTLRKRFGSHRMGRQAAFFLGRIHEQHGRLNEALSWLNTYLGEARKDAYVPEAAGRRLLLVQKLEGPLIAQKAAREYLERFPNGAYAGSARALLAQP